jgi:hypothetical protein
MDPPEKLKPSTGTLMRSGLSGLSSMDVLTTETNSELLELTLLVHTSRTEDHSTSLGSDTTKMFLNLQSNQFQEIPSRVTMLLSSHSPFRTDL